MHEIGVFWILIQFWGSSCFVTIDCKAQRVKCTGYIGMSDCLMPDLERIFPNMFGDHGNLYWPGRPTKFRNTSINVTERALTLNWEPPLDSSIRDVLGFFITIHGVDGLASGVYQCIVIELTQPLNTTHYKTPFSITYHPLFTSSIYDFKIISLPTADIELDPNEETLAAQLRIKTGKTNIENSPADWTTPMLCDIDGTTITAMLTWPPRRFKMSQIDVAITLLAENQSFIWENSSRISLSENQYGQSQKLHWDYSNFNDASYKRIMIMIRPVDVMAGLGQCVCYNANGLCVGSCRQSSCEVATGHRREESLAIRDSSKEDKEYTRLIPDHVIAVLTSLSLLLFSVVAAILLFVHKKGLLPRSSENPTNSNMLPNNLDASEALTSPEIVLPVNTSERQSSAFQFSSSYDTFIKPSSDLDDRSLTLSEQMLQINENYLTTVLCTGSQMSLYAERISLGNLLSSMIVRGDLTLESLVHRAHVWP